MIEKYHFGSIKIDGKTYNSDVQIGIDGQVSLWWRGKSHWIEKSDIKKALSQNPEIIVIGTGEMGVAKVCEEFQKEMESKGIKLVIEPTSKAVKSFNSLQKERKIAGLFHLTC